MDPRRPRGRSSSLRCGRSTSTPPAGPPAVKHGRRTRPNNRKTINGSTFTGVLNTVKGAYAQLAGAEEALCAVLDNDADLAVLAGFAAQAACAHLLLQASTTLRAGESLLVHGAAGGVGSLAVQIAKALGAGPVIGTASTAERREFVSAPGANAAISRRARMDRAGA